MSSTKSGFNIRDLTQHGKGELSHVGVNPGKVLPATATGNLFTVSGSIVVHGLLGVVTTVGSATSVSPTLGITGAAAALAAAPAVPWTTIPVGSVIIMPPTLGAALPAFLSAQSVVAAAGTWTCENTIITITTGATNTGAITWLLIWEPIFPKGATTYVTAD
jgi:hypothetical protein